MGAKTLTFDRIQVPDHHAHRQSLYQLCFPGPHKQHSVNIYWLNLHMDTKHNRKYVCWEQGHWFFAHVPNSSVCLCMQTSRQVFTKVVIKALESKCKWKWNGSTVSAKAFIIKFQQDPFRSPHTCTCPHTHEHNLLWGGFFCEYDYTVHIYYLHVTLLKIWPQWQLWNVNIVLEILYSFCKPQPNNLSSCHPIMF
jgi:hypothetical protein